jgi:hypothetical protein
MIQTKVNRLLLIGLRSRIIAPLNYLVKWDRYAIRNENDSGFIFGWIKRDDNFYDFVIVRFWLDWGKGMQFLCNYDTSSAKYSKEIGLKLGSSLEDYIECQPASDFPDANLAEWQKAEHAKVAPKEKSGKNSSQP